MKKVMCPACGGETKRSGRTSSGRTRWRCKSCGASTTQIYDDTAKLLKLFVGWLLSKRSQEELGMPARTFRHLTSRFWALWPVLPACDEVHHVVYMDGLWIGQSAVLLVACTDGHVIGCHLACSENSRDWGCLMSRIAAPDVLVCDGGGGIEKARRAHWPGVDACASCRPDEHGHVQVPIENPAKLPACWIRKRKTINPLIGLFFEGLT